MATIKAYTNIVQSRKLAEILSHESADMYYKDISLASFNNEVPNFAPTGTGSDWGFPCWSLTSLLSVLPNPSLHKTFSGWRCDSDNKEWTSCILGEPTDNPIDACVAMIEKLNELNLL